MSVHVSSESFVGRSIAQSSMSGPLRVAAVFGAVALTALAAQFTTPVPFTAVPFTFTPVAVLLAGAALGSRMGALSQAMYVLLGAFGFSVFAPSATLPPGLLRLAGPTGGYLLAYPFAAFAAGWLSERGWDRRYVTSFGALLAGLAIIYVGGASWLALAFLHTWRGAVTAGIVPFLVLDVLKMAAAAMILPQAWRVVTGRARS